MMNKFLFIGFFFFTACVFGSEWACYNAENSPLPSDSVYSVTKGVDGSLWFGTEKGLVCLQDRSWIMFGDEQGLVDRRITATACEKRDPFLFYLGTALGINTLSPASGDYRIDRLLTAANSGLPSDMITTMTIDENNLKLFGTPKGLAVFDGQKWQILNRTNALNREHVLSLYAHPDGWKYIGTRDGGVERVKFDKADLDGLTGASIIDRNWSGLLSDNVLSILIDSKERKWFGTDKGLCMHVGDETQKNWTSFTRDKGLAGDSVLAMAEDPEEGVWVGTTGGVSRLSGGVIRTYSLCDGLPGNTVFDIAVDNSGTVWLATNGGIAKKTAIAAAVENSHSLDASVELDVFPNPFQKVLNVSISSPTAQSAELLVFNVQGKVVKRIDLDLLHGNQCLVWDGRDNRQRPIARGIYFICLDTGQRVVAKVTLL